MLLTRWTLTLEAESMCFTLFHSVLCGGADVLPIPHATEVSVQHLQVLLWKLYPSLWRMCLWASGWSGCQFSFYPFYPSSDFGHSLMSFPLPAKMFRQILLFWRMLFWNTATAYGVIDFPLAEVTLPSVKYCILNCLARQKWTTCVFFSFTNFFKDIFLTHQCHHSFIKMGKKSSSLNVWNFKFVQMKICLHIKLNICFTRAIALLIPEVSRESCSEDITS